MSINNFTLKALTTTRLRTQAFVRTVASMKDVYSAVAPIGDQAWEADP